MPTGSSRKGIRMPIGHRTSTYMMNCPDALSKYADRHIVLLGNKKRAENRAKRRKNEGNER